MTHRAVSFSCHSLHDKMWIWHFLSKTSEATEQNQYSHLFHICWKENKCITKNIFSANALSHLFPLSVPSPPPHSYSTIKCSSRWFGFNKSRSWWGHSWRANTGTVSSICLWMDPHPRHLQLTDEGGTESPKGIEEKWTFGSDSIAVDVATKRFGSIRYNIGAILKSKVGFPSSHLTAICPNSFEAHKMEIPGQ